MNITAKFENNTLTIALEGNIDSVTAPEAEARITELRREYPEGEVVLDAEKLNYISSSGLRVILRLRKQEGALKLINVSSEVYEVLDITGFVDMMEVSRAMRTISAEDMILIDMADFSSGNPIYDFGSMFIGRYLTNAERKEKLLGLPEEDYNRFFALSLDACLADKTPEQRECFQNQAQVIMQLWFILFLRNSWAAVPTFIEKMYGIVRGRLLPNIEKIAALMAQDI